MSDRKSFAIILFVTAVILAIMLPIRDQIYRDDFAYAQSVKHFVDFGEIKVSEWAAPTLILQIFWGGLFSKILGFSFGTLHVSVIILLPIILIFFYKTLKELNVNNFNSFFLTVFFLSIPFILQFTYTFQTDIPFLALQIISIYFYLKGFKEGKSKNLLLGSTLAAAGFMVRQLGIILIVSALLTVLIKFRDSTKEQLFKKLFSLCLIPIFVISLYSIWLYSNSHQTITQLSYQNYLAKEIKTLIPFTNVNFTGRLSLFLLLSHRFVALFSLLAGLFAVPLSIITLFNLKKIKYYLNNLILILGFLIVFLLWGVDYIFFRETFVLGFPIDTYKYELLFPIPWPIIWKFLVVFGIFSFLLLISSRNFLSKKINNSNIFLFVSFIGFVVMSVTSKFYWDRYVIVFLPFVIIFTGLKLRLLNVPKFLLTIVVLFLLLDSLQMNKARYELNGIAQKEANNLVSMGISPIQIIPNQEEFWVRWYTFESQIAS